MAITYANDKQTDGAGAQLQRIYGIYAISRFLQIPYIHTPIKRIGYQGLKALENNRILPNVELNYNAIFKISSDIELPDDDPIIHEMQDADPDALNYLKQISGKENKFHLVRIVYPYRMTDRDPEMYHCVKTISPFQRAKSGIFRLAVHVRRGELFAVDSQRMLPNSYYVFIVMEAVKCLKELGIPFVCELYTELPSKPFIVTPQHHGIDNRIYENMTIDPKMNLLEDFDHIPNLTRAINLDPIENLKKMITADALIMSRSSYSYVAAILNSTGVIIYHPFWHNPLQKWVISTDNDGVFKKKVIRQLETWKEENIYLDQ